MKPLAKLAVDLAEGRATSRALTEECLARIADPAGEGARTFLKVWGEKARAAAEESDRRRARGKLLSALDGLPVSVKDLFDVAGDVTTAASVILRDAPPARADAPVVARLRAAGAVLVGRTNMTEFAYSGVGMNPHYGTPRNPHDRATGRIPGGSSSGAAVSVTDGLSAAALGTDTGGSVRLPAALCGLTGFKPTASRVPKEGVYPLSPTLDSVGPLAPTVSCCALLDAVLSDERPDSPRKASIQGLRLAVPRSAVLEGLDSHVSATFTRTLSRLSGAGARIQEIAFRELEEIPPLYRSGGLLSAEAYAWHRPLIEKHRDRYDPRVLRRLLRGAEHTETGIAEIRARRADLITRTRGLTEPFDAVVCPTVPIVAPRLSELERDEDFDRINLQLVRNTLIGNFLDRCAVSLPCHDASTAPVGLMLLGETGSDRRLLEVALAVEAALGQEA